jgi:hypothetical protein
MMSIYNGTEAEMAKGPTNLNNGGRCVYSSYEGIAEIIRIKQTPASRAQSEILGGPGYEGYEVWFRFCPELDYPIDRIKNIIIREHLLTLDNGWYAGSRYLEKYEIKAGRIFPCTLKVIEKGVCTPMVFEFETVDLKDYF